jgi:radical SAM protein with 4Fe4S-binding SPASM domain
MPIPVILQITNKQLTFPNRNFSEICGITVVEYITGRLRKAGAEPLTAAITVSEEDDSLEAVFTRHGVAVYRGDFEDIPSRLSAAAAMSGVNSFVRVLGNSPFTDIDMMFTLYHEHINGDFDYSYNGHEYGVLWGMDCDVMTTKCLSKLIFENLTAQQKQLFSLYIRQNKNRFAINRQDAGEKRPPYKLYLETQKDLLLLNDIAMNVETVSNRSIKAYLRQHRALAESNREEPKKEIGIDKLSLHPEKLKKILTNIQVDSSYPVSVELSLTNTCNLACVYCSDMDLRSRQGKNACLTLDTANGLFADLKTGGTKGVVIEGGGEPCLHPQINETIHAAKSHGLAVGLITNGTVMLAENTVSELEWIRVSLDASTKNEYLSLKRADRFETVLANITDYARHCTAVGVGYVVTRNNISELESLILGLRESGAAYIQLRPVVDCKELFPVNADLRYLTYYQTIRFSVIIDGMSENSGGGNFGIGCDCHSLTSVISADGSVYLCGRLNINDWLEPLGNINTQSFRSIWNGDKRREQALMVKNADFCAKHCPQCRISKFNRHIQTLKAIESKNFI